MFEPLMKPVPVTVITVFAEPEAIAAGLIEGITGFRLKVGPVIVTDVLALLLQVTGSSSDAETYPALYCFPPCSAAPQRGLAPRPRTQAHPDHR